VTEEASADVSMVVTMHGRDVLMSSRRLHSCLSYAVYFRGALVSGEMYSVRGETFPYELSQNVLQTLLGASVDA